jgi:hypothetical protein
MTTIRLTVCGGDHDTIEYRPTTKTLKQVKQDLRENMGRLCEDPESDAPLNFMELVGLFCIKKFGRNCFFHQDNGLPTGYGQVFEALPQRLGGGNSSKTGRVLFEVIEN